MKHDRVCKLVTEIKDYVKNFPNAPRKQQMCNIKITKRVKNINVTKKGLNYAKRKEVMLKLCKRLSYVS